MNPLREGKLRELPIPKMLVAILFAWCVNEHDILLFIHIYFLSLQIFYSMHNLFNKI